MKKTKFLAMLLFALFSGVMMSCSSDDDEGGNGGGGNASATINLEGTSARFNNVYWTSEAGMGEGQGENLYQLEFYTFDVYGAMNGSGKIPSMFSTAYISFSASGSLTELPTGTYAYGDYELSGLIGATMSNPEGKFYLEEGRGSGSLSISKNGNNYNVSIVPLNIAYIESEKVDKGNESDVKYKEMNFSYSGPIRYISDGLSN